MKALRRSFLLFLVISLVFGSLYSEGWAQEKNATKDEYNMIDLLIARPLGVFAAALGTGIFIITLPFTLPTRSVEDSFNIFVVEPWKFSYVRDFPDEEIL